MGPATLTETYLADQLGIVTAVLRFNTGKPRYTADEALALRKAVLEVNKQDAVMITFDQAGAKLLAAGKTREALAADRALIASRPGDVLNHARMAYALLQAGIGDQASRGGSESDDPRSEVCGCIQHHTELGARVQFDRRAIWQRLRSKRRTWEPIARRKSSILRTPTFVRTSRFFTNMTPTARAMLRFRA